MSYLIKGPCSHAWTFKPLCMIRTSFNKLIVITFLLMSSLVMQAQDSTTKKLSFKIGTYYNSNLNYYGRTDSSKSSGVFPMAELWLNNKFYINAIFTK